MTDDLDSRILAAERAVIERDERVRRDASELARRLHLGGASGAAGLRRPGLALGGAATTLGKLLFSGGSSRGTGKAAAGGAGGALLAGLMRLFSRRRSPRWAPLLALAWPLAPRALRSRIGPATATALLGAAIPLLASGKRSKLETQARPRRVEPAPRVDLPRFAGRWFEVARLPASFERGCNRDVMAQYTLDNGELRIVNRCRQRSGRVRLATGVGRPVRGGNDARLKVSFAPTWLRWLPGTWEPYWILRIDPEYRTALVGTPDRKFLWLLSRAPQMDNAQFLRLVDHAREQGYDVSRLAVTPQSGWGGRG